MDAMREATPPHSLRSPPPSHDAADAHGGGIGEAKPPLQER